MTILITDMGNTVIASFKRGTFTLADWTVLPKAGVWRAFIEKHPWLLHWLQKKAEEANKRAQEAATSQRIRDGFPIGPVDEDLEAPPPTLEEIVEDEERQDEHTLGNRLAQAIRRTAHDLIAEVPRRYSYEEWVEFTRLIRFTRLSQAELEEAEEEQGLVEWDWIGEDSPMLADETESEWLLHRLCESLDRYMHLTKDMSRQRREQRELEGEEEEDKQTPESRRTKKRKTT